MTKSEKRSAARTVGATVTEFTALRELRMRAVDALMVGGDVASAALAACGVIPSDEERDAMNDQIASAVEGHFAPEAEELPLAQILYVFPWLETLAEI